MNHQIEEVKKRLNQVSPSFCLAKWTQATLHLHSGMTHSCHHTKSHSISPSEIKKDPSRLHNTDFKMLMRKKMLEGERPSECGYCWAIEDLGQNLTSDRHLKSADFWSEPYFDEVSTAPWSKPYEPRYIEVSFSRTCNFKCSYCSSNFSSSWAQDIQHNGPYPGHTTIDDMLNLNQIYSEENNPFIKSFWEWWPKLIQSLKVLRITGGEPLLSENTFKMLEQIGSSPALDLQLSVNSNLGVSEKRIERFSILAKAIIENKKVSYFSIYTSIEAAAEKAEYIRYGLKTDLFWRNVEYLLEQIPALQITVMCTFNALSVTSFQDFLACVLKLRKKYSSVKRPIPLLIDISYLRNPSFMTAQILPTSYNSIAEKLLGYMKEHSASNTGYPWGFLDYEITKMKRLVEWIKAKPNDKLLSQNRATFHRFFKAHDLRRKTDRFQTFPEMADFFHLCKNSWLRQALSPINVAKQIFIWSFVHLQTHCPKTTRKLRAFRLGTVRFFSHLKAAHLKTRVRIQS